MCSWVYLPQPGCNFLGARCLLCLFLSYPVQYLGVARCSGCSSCMSGRRHGGLRSPSPPCPLCPLSLVVQCCPGPGCVPGSVSFLSLLCWAWGCSWGGHSYTEVIELVFFCPDHRWSVSIVCYFITAPMTHAIFLPGHFPAQSLSFWRAAALWGCTQPQIDLREMSIFKIKRGTERRLSAHPSFCLSGVCCQWVSGRVTIDSLLLS